MDALAALKCWPIVVEVGGREYTIPAAPAAEWFLAILGDKPLPIVPGMLPTEQEDELADRIAYGEVALREVVQVSREALEVASGWRWWEADRIIRSSGEQWKVVGGKLAQAGVDLHREPLGAVLNTIYTLAIANLDEQARQKLDFQISQPPAGLADEDREALAEQMFQDLLATAASPQG